MENFKPVANSVFDSFEIDQSYLPVGENEDARFQELRKVLIRRIEELIEKDVEKLKWILYRIDVNEKKVHEALATNEQLHYPEVLADLIIERQIEKAKTRAQFNEGPTDWSFDV
jgi:phage-related minor tail protein